MKFILKITFFLIILFCSHIAKGQTNQTQAYSQLIIGTWIQEESPEIREVYFANGTQEMYIDNVLFETNYWEITSGQTPSGLTISHLKLINTQDANDVFVFEINGLNQERLVLVYQRLGGGLGQLTTYLRQ